MFQRPAQQANIPQPQPARRDLRSLYEFVCTRSFIRDFFSSLRGLVFTALHTRAIRVYIYVYGTYIFCSLRCAVQTKQIRFYVISWSFLNI